MEKQKNIRKEKAVNRLRLLLYVHKYETLCSAACSSRWTPNPLAEWRPSTCCHVLTIRTRSQQKSVDGIIFSIVEKWTRGESARRLLLGCSISTLYLKRLACCSRDATHAHNKCVRPQSLLQHHYAAPLPYNTRLNPHRLE
eukprot:1195379-Prorocentrum_minimum.AAC.5